MNCLQELINFLGKRSIAVTYKCTPKGYTFCKNVLEPHEKLFPRSERLTPSDQVVAKEPRYLIEVNQCWYENFDLEYIRIYGLFHKRCSMQRHELAK